MRVLVANNFPPDPLISQQAAKVCQCYRHCFVPTVRLSCGLRECSSNGSVEMNLAKARMSGKQKQLRGKARFLRLAHHGHLGHTRYQRYAGKRDTKGTP